jgi:hypothetical protein
MNHPIRIAFRERVDIMREVVRARSLRDLRAGACFAEPCRPAALRSHRGKGRNGDEEAA